MHILQATMPYDEMLKWQAYFELRPVGWRDDLRAANLVRVQTDKADIYAMFPSLKVIQNKGSKKTVTESLVGSAFFSKMLSAKGGDKLDFLEEVK